MSLRELLQARATKIGEMRAMLDLAESEGRDLTEDEAKAYDTLKADQEKLSKKIERLEEQEKLEAMLQQARPAKSQPSTSIPRAGGPEAKREFENIGEFLFAACRNQNDQRLASLYTEFENKAEQRMDTGSAGGFLVPQQFRETLLSVTPQSAIVRPRATVIPAGSPPDSVITMPALDQDGDNPDNMYGGVKFEWVGEGGGKPETSAEFRMITLQPHEIAAHIVVTDKLLRNWAAASAVLESQMRGAMFAAEDRAFLNGNGIAKPLGILSSAACYNVPRGTANQVDYDDLVAMVARVRGPGVWVYSKSVLPELMTLTDQNGNLIWNGNAREGELPLLLGRPAIENERNPLLGQAGDIWLADMSQYLIKDGSGPYVAASEHVHFLSNKTVIKMFWNVDGQPWLTAPIKQEGGYEVSPFVKLV